MSYDVSLVDEDGVMLPFDHMAGEGGTYAIGGTSSCELNITYNYGEVFKLVLPNYRGLADWLGEKRASDVIVDLRSAVERLGTQTYKVDYWAPTPGNAGHALSILLAWAERYPGGKFEVV